MKKTIAEKRLYWIWAAMIQRCENPNNKQYKDYGGRGITVCDSWFDYQQFKADMGYRPKGCCLDRIDNDGNYCPENVTWADRGQSSSNRRNCIYLDDGPEKVTLKEYCRRHGLKYRAIHKRITQRNWPIEKAVSLPLGSRLAT